MKNKGFTLIELIIVIAIIALLAAATFVAVNPAKRIGDANNAQRWSDVTAIADAWALYLADNNGSLPTSTIDGTTGISGATLEIVSQATGVSGASDSCGATPSPATSTTNIIMLDALVSGGYIGAVPGDPQYSGSGYSNYYLYTNTSTGQLIVGACQTYNGETIRVIR